MSKAIAKKTLEDLIEKRLKKSGRYREQLNVKIHVMDLSLETLLKTNRIQSTERDLYTKAHKNFIEALVSTVTREMNDEKEAIFYVTSQERPGSVLVNKNFLVTKTYGIARTTLTSASSKIPTNQYFGQSYRAREYSEYVAEKDVETLENLDKIAGRAFIRFDFRASTVVKTTEGSNWVYSIKAYKNIAYKEIGSNNYNVRPITEKDVGRQILVRADKLGPESITTDSGEEALILDLQVLSKLDVGHIYSSRTPLKEKFKAFERSISKIDFGEYQENIYKIVKDAEARLNEIHGNIAITYSNDITKNRKRIAVITVTPQLYEINGAIAKEEAAALNDVIKNVMQIAATLPGSNTLTQDLVELTKNKLLLQLGLPGKKIKPHEPVSVKVALPNAKLIQDNVKISLSKTKKPSKPSKPLLSRTITGQFFSLASLQRLLDASLVQRVKSNMGTGSRRDILNLRSGRFAESVKVERLSQSREGMITAFYNYMRNPYATFSQGGRQELPRSRDPKLLIAKSIREIGATMVANRMRAVLV